MAGWMFVLAYLSVVTGIVRRAAAITEPSFEDGLWWQRIEVISQSSLPQLLIVLAPAAIAAIAGQFAVRTIVDRSVLRLTQLVRAIAGVCYVVIAIGIIGIIGVLVRSPDSVGDVGQILGRAGGILMAVAMIRVCLESERSV